jgi:Xaa-Pro aminopeptidase
MEQWMREKGYEQAFEPIVAIDANSAVPHYDTKRGNNQKLRNGSVLLLDYGVQYESYNSDISRMIFIGDQSTEIMTAYEGLRKAQEETVQFVQKAKSLKEVDLFCRAELKKAGLPDFPHSTGHGVGIEVHESPKVSFRSTDQIKPFQILTIEPGIYFPDKWGMRVEDTVFVDEKTQVKSLTKFPKKYLQL